MSGDRDPSMPPSFAPPATRPRPVGADGATVVGAGRPIPPGPPSPPRPPAAPARSEAPAGSSGAPASFSPAAARRPPVAPAVEVGSRRSTGRPVESPSTRSGEGSSTRSPASPSTRSAASPSTRSPSAAAQRVAAPATPPRPAQPRSASSRPATVGGGSARTPAPPPRTGVPAPRRRRRWKALAAVAVVLLVALAAWPIGLVIWANGKVQHTAALSGAAATPGTTYLLTGADTRDAATGNDGTTGSRTDTILLLHVPTHGPAALISLPRDTYIEDIPGHGPGKLNAAFAYGGAPLLVQVVERLTGLTIDHYAEIGMVGVVQVVDTIGGVSLCYHTVDGRTALTFVRMRKSDPEGDIGRAKRQRQLIQALTSSISPRDLVLHPSRQVTLIKAGTAAITVDTGSDIVDLGRMALAFKSAEGPGGITGTPPIANVNYRPGGVGSTVLLDPAASATFWTQIADGALPAGVVGGMPG